jgi:tetratricopeptide (TPR) repeat protein/tRNA A-37 threonylcarbamoyl transferase component Bud32
MPTTPTNSPDPPSPAALETATAPTVPAPPPPGCLDLGALEAIAAGRAAGPAEESHLVACDSCRRTLEDARANDVLLRRFRLALSAGAAGAPLPADLVPGYRLLEEISRGSQGVVYRALQERTRRVVALKMLLRGTFATEKQRRRFEREVEIGAALKHPGIVTIYDVTPVRGGRCAYAMEYVPGLHLDAWQPTGKTPRERRAAILRLFIQVCEAVQYAHNNGVIHRDLKPANIIVDDAGNAHVLDFGIAKATGASAQAMATQSLEFAGTLAYASPEQVAGDPELVDARTDVYSLGVMLYLMLCGRHPFSLEGSLLDVAARIRAGEPARPREIDPSISRDLEEVVLHALRKDPRERYQSPGGLGADLRRALRGDPVSVKRDSAWYVLRKALVRRRRTIAALLAIAIVVAYFSIQAVLARARAASARQLAADETARVGALSTLLHDILPPLRQRPVLSESLRIDEGLQRLRGKVFLGYMADDPAREAAAQTLLALALRDRGQLALAEEAMRLGLCRLVAEHGERHPAVAQTLHDLAGVLLDRRRLWEAQNSCEQALRMRVELFGAADARTADSRALRARILVTAERPAEAVTDALAAAAILAASGSAGELALARCLDTLSAAQLALGRDADAKDSCRQALAIRLDRLSDDDPELAESLARLADVLVVRGLHSADLSNLARSAGLADAHQLADHLRKIAEDLAPPDIAPDAPGGRSPGDEDRAGAALRDLLALKRAVLGDRSRGVGQTLAAIGWRLLDAREYVQAEAPLRDATSILEAQYGPHDLVVANCLERLAESFIGQRRFAEAADCASRELKIRQRQPGAALEGLTVAVCQRELARNLTRIGRFDDAITNFREAIGVFEANCGPMHHSRGLAMSQCALALLGAGRLDEAEEMARRGRDIALQHAALPGDQRMQIDAALGLTLLARDKPGEAEPLLENAQRIFFHQNWTEDARNHPDLLVIQEALGRIRGGREGTRAPEPSQTPAQPAQPGG